MRLALFVGLLSAVLLAAVATSSPGTTGSKQFSCRQQLLDFVFWPHGHGAIRSVGFSAYKAPHLEIYRDTSSSSAREKYSSKNLLVFAAANRRTSVSKTCDTDTGAPPGGSILTRKISTGKLALTCAAALTGVVRMKPIPSGLRIDVGRKLHRVLSADLTKTGATLAYSEHSCRAGPVPH